MSSQTTLGEFAAADRPDCDQLTDEEIREHYRRITPVFRELGDSCGLRTLGVADLKRWYLSEEIDDGDPLTNAGWTHRRRPTGLRGDADVLSEKVDRSYYAVLNYQSPSVIQEGYRPARFEVTDGETETVWGDGKHPLPDYPDVEALALFADIDIKDEYKERPLPEGKRAQFEAVIESHVDVLADLIGGREHVYVLDSVGGAYVFTAPQVTAPIGDRLEGRARGRVFEAIAERSRDWLGPRFDDIHRDLGTVEWAKTDTQISRSRQYKGPLSIHASIDGVVTPIDTDDIQYTFTPFGDVDESLLEEALEWCREFTSPVHGDGALDGLISELFDDYYPTAPANPETFEDHTEVVMGELLGGDGELFNRRCEQLREAIELARERGFVHRAALIDRLYGDDQAGYSDAKTWYKHTIYHPTRALEERTGMIESEGGLRWPASIPEPVTFEDHVERVAARMVMDDYDEELLEQRRERFRQAVAFIQEHGVATQGDLVEALYTPDDGYSSPHTWCQQLVARHIRELEERTGAIKHDRDAGEHRYPEAIPDPETFDEHLQWVADREIPGDGDEFSRRRERFLEVIDTVRETGAVTRDEIVAACCPSDLDGYSTPKRWYRSVVHGPVKALAERTDEIELPRGEIRYPDAVDPDPEPETFDEYVEQIAETEIRGGPEFGRRQEQFRAAVDLVRERGAVSKSEFVDEFCPDDNAGYGTVAHWYANVVRNPFQKLSENTDEIEVSSGEVRYPDAVRPVPENPETLEEHAIVVASEEIPGAGGMFRRRSRAFLDAVEYVTAEGVATRAELIEELYQEDNDLGYSSPDSWWVRIVNTPFKELEERADAIVREPGEIHHTG